MAPGRIVTFGDPCPGCKTGVAVHDPIIAAISADGDVILPQFYALCCSCHHAQHLVRHGDAEYAPCNDEQIAIDLRLMHKPPQPGFAGGTVTGS